MRPRPDPGDIGRHRLSPSQRVFSHCKALASAGLGQPFKTSALSNWHWCRPASGALAWPRPQLSPLRATPTERSTLSHARRKAVHGMTLLPALSLLLKNRPLSSPGFLHPHLPAAIPGTESVSRHDRWGQRLGGVLGPTRAPQRRRVRKNASPQLLPKCHQPLAGYEDYLGTVLGMVRAATLCFSVHETGEEAMATVVMKRVRGGQRKEAGMLEALCRGRPRPAAALSSPGETWAHRARK